MLKRESMEKNWDAIIKGTKYAHKQAEEARAREAEVWANWESRVRALKDQIRDGKKEEEYLRPFFEKSTMPRMLPALELQRSRADAAFGCKVRSATND
jgi:hypothetical protein